MNPRQLGTWAVALCGVLLAGCVSAPAAVEPPARGLRVLSFAAEKDVRMGASNGAPEERPGWLSTDREAYDRFLKEALTQAWSEFPRQFNETFGLEVQGPGVPDEHPQWTAFSREPVSEADFVPHRARGFYWPSEFRFVDPVETLPGSVVQEFPEELLLTVEYRLFTQDRDEAAEGREFHLGIVARLRLYDGQGQLLAAHSVEGLSEETGGYRGGRVDRNAYPRLLNQAQGAALKAWSRRITFGRGTESPPVP